MRLASLCAVALLIPVARYVSSKTSFVACQTEVTQPAEHISISGESAMSLTKGGNEDIQILHVLECEGPQEWQPVNATDSVVIWMRALTDRLTVTDDRPHGEDLTVHNLHYLPTFLTHSQPVADFCVT